MMIMISRSLVKEGYIGNINPLSIFSVAEEVMHSLKVGF